MTTVDPLAHGAVLYRGEDEFLAATIPFLHEGLALGEAILVNLAPARIAAVRSTLGADAEGLLFNDMRVLGANPSRLLSAWLVAIEEQALLGRRVRGVGEPVWPGRTRDEYDECDLHEALINRLTDSGVTGRVLCPYDALGLPAREVERALDTHPALVEGATVRPNTDHDAHAADRLFRRALTAPPGHATTIDFDAGGLTGLRGLIASHGEDVGLARHRVADLMLVVTEAATNSVRYGGGHGVLRIWTSADAVIVDVRDRGFISDPLAGRVPPPFDATGGRGLWIINQLCDLVQVRSPDGGANVRVHMWRR